MAGLDADARLRDLVVAHLRAHGHDSISGIARTVSAGRDRPIHRLTVAGYLEALADVGILKEVDRPPSRTYQLQEPAAHRTLHQRVWRAVNALRPPDPPALLLATLQALLQRPVFLAELRHAGAGPDTAHLPRAVLEDDERRHHKRALGRGTYRIEVPPRDPMLALGEPHLAELAPLVQEVARRVALASTGAVALQAERPPAQASLEESA